MFQFFQFVAKFCLGLGTAMFVVINHKMSRHLVKIPAFVIIRYCAAWQ